MSPEYARFERGQKPAELQDEDLLSVGAGRFGGEELVSPMEEEAPRVPVGSQVLSLIEAISELEERYDYLLDRNKVLMGKVMMMRSSYAGKSMMGNDKVRRRRCFEGWKDFIQNHRLENQLDKQTHALDDCQQVAKELGHVLAEEQERRKEMDQIAFNTREDIRRVLANTEAMQQGKEDMVRRMAMMQSFLHEAEALIAQSRYQGHTVINHADDYEKRKAELERHIREGRPLPKKKGKEEKEVTMEDKIDHSTMVRNEAQGTISNARALLPPNIPRSSSPERERPGHMRQNASQFVAGTRDGASPTKRGTVGSPAPAGLAGPSYGASPSRPAYPSLQASPLAGPGSQAGMGSPVRSHDASPMLRGGRPPAGPDGQVMEPWWCVRRVGPDGRPTVTPQAPQA